jgi:hypothetical protein
MLGHGPLASLPLSAVPTVAATTFQSAWARGVNVLLSPGSPLCVAAAVCLRALL